MGTPYTGNAALVSNALTRTVTNATNATPIVITTSVNHLFASNDSVRIFGQLGNTAANGTWTITVLSATTFSLNGSVGNGAPVGNSTAVDESYTPQYTIPSDGDANNAASVNVALQSLGDRTQHAVRRLGRWRIVDEAFVVESTVLTVTNPSTTTTQTLAAVGTLAVDTIVGDVVQLIWTGTFTLVRGAVAGATTGTVLIKDSQNGGAFAAISGASAVGQVTVASSTWLLPYAIACARTITVAGSYEPQVTLNLTSAGAADSVSINSVGGMIMRLLRPN